MEPLEVPRCPNCDKPINAAGPSHTCLPNVFHGQKWIELIDRAERAEAALREKEQEIERLKNRIFSAEEKWREVELALCAAEERLLQMKQAAECLVSEIETGRDVLQGVGIVKLRALRSELERR
jgi:hypothetical protein